MIEKFFNDLKKQTLPALQTRSTEMITTKLP